MSIQISKGSGEQVAAEVKKGLGGYTDFRLKLIQPAVPDPIKAGSDHDKTVKHQITQSMDKWAQLVTSDADGVVSAVESISGVDQALAVKMLGVDPAATTKKSTQ